MYEWRECLCNTWLRISTIGSVLVCAQLMNVSQSDLMSQPFIDVRLNGDVCAICNLRRSLADQVHKKVNNKVILLLGGNLCHYHTLTVKMLAPTRHPPTFCSWHTIADRHSNMYVWCVYCIFMTLYILYNMCTYVCIYHAYPYIQYTQHIHT